MIKINIKNLIRQIMFIVVESQKGIRMKKILFIVSCVFFLFSSYLFVNIYANKEIKNILEEDSKYTVSVTEVQDQEKTVESLKKIAAANSVNIQKAIYRL